MTFSICGSVAVCSITMTIGLSLLAFLVRLVPATEPLQTPGLVDDPLEHAPHGQRLQRPRVLAHHPLQDPGLALRGVEGQPAALLDAADLHRAGGAAVEQAHELLVDGVDAPPPGLDLR